MRFCGTKRDLRRITKGSVFHVFGDIQRESLQRSPNIAGLMKVGRVLGGAVLSFSDVITVKEAISRLEGLKGLTITAVVDVSASLHTALPYEE